MSWEILMAVLVIALVATLVAVVVQTRIDDPVEVEQGEPVIAQDVPDYAIFEPVEQTEPIQQASEPTAVISAPVVIDQIAPEQMAVTEPAPDDIDLRPAITTGELFETVEDEEFVSPAVEALVDEPDPDVAAPEIAEVAAAPEEGKENPSETRADSAPTPIEDAPTEAEIVADRETVSAAIEPTRIPVEPIADPEIDATSIEPVQVLDEPIVDPEPASTAIEPGQDQVQPGEDPEQNQEPMVGSEPVAAVEESPVDVVRGAVPEPDELSTVQAGETSTSEADSVAEDAAPTPAFNAQTATAELFAPPETWADRDPSAETEPSPESDSTSSESESSSDSE